MSELLPAESMALTVALAQLARGENPPPNTSAACIFALERLRDAGEPPTLADDTVQVPRDEWDALVDAVRLERAEMRSGQPHVSAVYHAWERADDLVSAVEANR